MKNTSLKRVSFLFTALLCSSTLLSPSVSAAPTKSAETTAKLQQVCRGKSVGAPVSMIKGKAIFNGTCELKFAPNSHTMRGIDNAKLVQACEGKEGNASTSIAVNGRTVNGKCVLAFHNIQPETTTAS